MYIITDDELARIKDLLLMVLVEVWLEIIINSAKS